MHAGLYWPNNGLKGHQCCLYFFSTMCFGSIWSQSCGLTQCLCCQHLIVSLSNIISSTGERPPKAIATHMQLARVPVAYLRYLFLWHHPHKDINFLSVGTYGILEEHITKLSNCKRKEKCLSELTWLKPGSHNVFLKNPTSFPVASVCLWPRNC